MIRSAPFIKSSLGWLWLVAFAVLLMLGIGMRQIDQPRPAPGTQAPLFEMTFFNGYEWNNAPSLSLEGMQGQIVVLNFWASWCAECHREAALLQAYSEKYANRGVVFLGIAWADSEPKSLAFLEAFDITYPNGPDLGSDIVEKYEISQVPATFFIDQTGEIAQVIYGPVNEDILEGTISALLAKE